MSRIGKKPIPVPAGVDVTIDGTNVTVKGPKGELSKSFYDLLTITQEGNEIIVTRPDDSRTCRARHGLTRALLHNMVVGVSEGFSKKRYFQSVQPLHRHWSQQSSHYAAYGHGAYPR